MTIHVPVGAHPVINPIPAELLDGDLTWDGIMRAAKALDHKAVGHSELLMDRPRRDAFGDVGSATSA